MSKMSNLLMVIEEMYTQGKSVEEIAHELHMREVAVVEAIRLYHAEWETEAA